MTCTPAQLLVRAYIDSNNIRITIMKFLEFMEAHWPQLQTDADRLRFLKDQWGLITATLDADREKDVSRIRVNVEQMDSPRSSRPVANQFIIHTPQGIYFQSYQTICAFKRRSDGKVFLDETGWNYSRTTSKYLHEFLLKYDRAGIVGSSAKENLKAGKYTLADLNKAE